MSSRGRAEGVWRAEAPHEPAATPPSGKRIHRRGRQPARPLTGAAALAAAALDEAAARVARGCAERADSDLFVSQDVDGSLRLVTLAIHVATGQDEAEGLDAALLGQRVVHRRMIELLRSALLDVWAEQPTLQADAMLALLRGIEAVRRRLDPEWARDTVSLLASPDGLSLVTEVAHDLRSPLTAVLFLADNLRRGYSGPLNEVQSRQIGIIYGAALGLVEVSGGLIDLARDDSAPLTGEPRPYSLADLLDGVRMLVQPIVEEKGLELRTVSDRPDQRMGHPVLVQRALLNLATNALKFTDSGYVEISARASGRQRIRFAVEDTGRGISEAAKPTLFQPFRARAESGYAFSGTGLGLVIVRRIVRELGGELEYETAPDQGTRFHFTLTSPPCAVR